MTGDEDSTTADDRHETHEYRASLVDLRDLNELLKEVHSDIYRRFNSEDIRQVKITVEQETIHERD